MEPPAIYGHVKVRCEAIKRELTFDEVIGMINKLSRKRLYGRRRDCVFCQVFEDCDDCPASKYFWFLTLHPIIRSSVDFEAGFPPCRLLYLLYRPEDRGYSVFWDAATCREILRDMRRWIDCWSSGKLAEFRPNNLEKIRGWVITGENVEGWGIQE